VLQSLVIVMGEVVLRDVRRQRVRRVDAVLVRPASSKIVIVSIIFRSVLSGASKVCRGEPPYGLATSYTPTLFTGTLKATA